MPPRWGQQDRDFRSGAGVSARVLMLGRPSLQRSIVGTDATSAPSGTLKHHSNVAMNAAIILKSERKERPEGR